MKKVQVIWTDESLGELKAIYDFLAEKSPNLCLDIPFCAWSAFSFKILTDTEMASPQILRKCYLVEFLIRSLMASERWEAK